METFPFSCSIGIDYVSPVINDRDLPMLAHWEMDERFVSVDCVTPGNHPPTLLEHQVAELLNTIRDFDHLELEIEQTLFEEI